MLWAVCGERGAGAEGAGGAVGFLAGLVAEDGVDGLFFRQVVGVCVAVCVGGGGGELCGGGGVLL